MSYQTNKFISTEALAGLLLIFFTILALIASNTALSSIYAKFLNINLIISIGDFGLDKPILLWINDGLMSLFFLMIGLELKRECLTGELQTYHKVILPIFGAIGGMLIPALFYFLITRHHPSLVDGWAIPMATDIAFALGVLALFSRRVPLSLKLFLMTLAIIDDLGAILVIGIFHTADLSWLSLLFSILNLLILYILNRLHVDKLSFYLLVGLVMWVCVLNSGFHATIAGVLLAMMIPLRRKDNQPLLTALENDLHTLVAFLILPLFVFANAGVAFTEITINSFLHPLVMAIVIGLIVGKIVGIVSFTLIGKKLFRVQLDFTNSQLLGVSLLCGIGFTMSLFISGLSFGFDETLLNLSRLGILSGSLIAMVSGIVILYFTLPKN